MPLNHSEKKLSIALCALVGELIVGSHDSLESLYISAGAIGIPPDLAHHSKWKQWLRNCSQDPECDAYSVVGKVVEEFMEVEPTHPLELIEYKKNHIRLIEQLRKDGLVYRKGGIIEQIPRGSGIQSLSDSLARKDFHQLDIEFERAMLSIENDPASAITASCAILEALFISYLENRLIELPNKKSIKPLWQKVQKSLGLDPKNRDDEDISKILSGLSSIVDGVGAFRTHAGSAHGGGTLRYKVQSRHAKLTVNSAHTIALFVIETWENKYRGGFK